MQHIRIMLEEANLVSGILFLYIFFSSFVLFCMQFYFAFLFVPFCYYVKAR